MDYEKKYKESLKKAEAFYYSATTEPITEREVLANIFPELQESGDERMRNAAINACKYMVDNFENSTKQYEDAISWLEKQGEQKTVDEIAKEVCKDKASAVAFLKSAGIMNEKGELAEPYRQDEQKPVDKVKPKFKVGDVVANKKSKDTVKIVQILHDSYCYSGWDGASTVHSDFSISEQDNWEFVKQKPAWSEEDERNLNWVINVWNRLRRGGDAQTTPSQMEYLENFLKSLKSRVQSKQEWSEDDEKGLSDALWAIKQASSIAKDENDMGNVWYAENWLKSLKQRYTWKPSERMLEALKLAKCEFHPDCSETMEQLKYLYQELKQLYYDRT